MDEEMNIPLTDEEIARQEAERAEREEKELAPFRAAAKQRHESAEIIAEHDSLMADMLYELTMNEFGEKV